ncbi:MAG: hypothetical protein ACR2G2_06640 [Pseudonocardia sp.]
MSTDEISVVNLLWKDARRAGESLESQLRKANVSSAVLLPSGPLAAPAYRVLDQRISEVLQSAVNIDLGGVMTAAWTGYQDLLAAASRTRDTPDPPEDVVLAEHEIASTHQPVVQILVNGLPAKTVTFDLVLLLKVRSVVAVVHGGKLVALRGGQVAAEARLELSGTVLARSEGTWLAGAVVKLGDGIPLVSPAPSPAIRTTAPPTPAAAPPAAAPNWVHRVSIHPRSAPAANPVPAQPGAPWWERTAPAAPTNAATWWERNNGDGQSGQR